MHNLNHRACNYLHVDCKTMREAIGRLKKFLGKIAIIGLIKNMKYFKVCQEYHTNKFLIFDNHYMYNGKKSFYSIFNLSEYKTYRETVQALKKLHPKIRKTLNTKDEFEL